MKEIIIGLVFTLLSTSVIFAATKSDNNYVTSEEDGVKYDACKQRLLESKVGMRFTADPPTLSKPFRFTPESGDFNKYFTVRKPEGFKILRLVKYENKLASEMVSALPESWRKDKSKGRYIAYDVCYEIKFDSGQIAYISPNDLPNSVIGEDSERASIDQLECW